MNTIEERAADKIQPLRDEAAKTFQTLSTEYDAAVYGDLELLQFLEYATGALETLDAALAILRAPW